MPAAPSPANLLIIGAASNLIVVHRPERRGVHLSFWDFALLGIPLTALQVLVYLAGLSLSSS